MRRFGLIGHPLGHSFSRGFFTKKFSDEGYDALYSNYELSSLSALLKLIDDNRDIEGLNVTLPYKTEIIKFLDDIEPRAGEIGAVNVISIEHIGEKTFMKGYNTDIIGFMGSIKEILNSNISSALVLGSGGSSLAVRRGLKEIGIEYKTVSRHKSRGDLIYGEITREIIKAYPLIINTTPVGMFPDISELPGIPYEYLDGHNVLFDLVYNPELTSFLKKGIERGCRTKGGLEMLHIQAEEAWKIWNSKT